MNTERTDTDITPQEGETVEEISEELEETAAEQSEDRRFGTFGGVFVPTLLTILGVIMYLRTGWVVGNAGLGGAWLIIGFAFLITSCTGLSMACFVTNLRVGKGGAFSMISQSLGLEAGGSIGIPLYLSQVLAVSMYVFGFRDGWLWIFPTHDPLYVDLITFGVIFVITFVSARLAVRVQYLIMAVIVLSLGSVGAAALGGSMQYPVTVWGDFAGDPAAGISGGGFWYVFAVFFPASTGIMAGANMSGELRNARRSIPLGTMGAIGLSFLVYMGLAYWLARSATTQELMTNYTVLIDRAASGPLVLAGLLAATFSSGLVSFVGGPRILQALAEHKLIPGNVWFARRTRGEPLHAIVFSSLIVLTALMLRDLNAIAPLITMFFLVTYSAINLIVLIEQNLGLLSFRPTLQIPRYVPFAGLVGCLTAMFIINSTMGLVAMLVVAVIYALLMRKNIPAPFGDVRSGIVMAVAEWAAKRIHMMEGAMERVWKPHLLVPARSGPEVRTFRQLIVDLASPSGSIQLLGISRRKRAARLRSAMKYLKLEFQEENLYCASSALYAKDFGEGVRQGMETLSGTIFEPNLLLMSVPSEEDSLGELAAQARGLDIGVAYYIRDEERGLGERKVVNVWINDQGPRWKIDHKIENLDTCLLLAYRLSRSWEGDLNLIVALSEPDQEDRARGFLGQLSEEARLPGETRVVIAGDSFKDFARKAPRADINVIPLHSDPDLDYMGAMSVATESSCLFVQDGGEESALA